jgi:hypothetical protein
LRVLRRSGDCDLGSAPSLCLDKAPFSSVRRRADMLLQKGDGR